MSRLVKIITTAGRSIAAPKCRAFAPQMLPRIAVNIRYFGDHAHGEKNEPFMDPKEVTARIIEVIKNFDKVNAAKVSATARFKEDLDLDSLDAVEVVMAIEEEFAIEIPESEADKIFSVADAVAFISQHPMAK